MEPAIKRYDTADVTSGLLAAAPAPEPHVSRILLVEDNERIARFVERGLSAAGHRVDVATEGATALRLARSGHLDLVILDLGLPDMDGLEVLGTLRAEGSQVPVIILTARGEIPDKVVGFEAGADDYLTKPFAFAELLVRVRARLKTTQSGEVAELRHGDLRLDLRTRQVAAPGIGERELSAREFGLLETLMREPARVFSKEELLDRVWGINFDPQSNVVEVYIRYLRIKIGAERIATVRGGGYRMAQ